jgi:MYXO-CTERM domain-containing protein
MIRAWPLAGLLCVSAAAAQTHEEFCLPADEIDAGQGLRLAVSPQGDLHLLRVKRVGGHLLHTIIGADGAPETTQVAERISRLAIDEVEHFDLRWDGDGLLGCWYDASFQRLQFGAWTPDAGWSVETVTEAGVLDGCRLARAGARLWVVYSSDAGLSAAWREGEGAWASEVVQAGAVGDSPDVVGQPDGSLLVAHRGLPGDLWVSSWDGAWDSTLVEGFGLAWGVSPQLVVDAEGWASVVHGLVGQDSDAGLMHSMFGPEGWVTEGRAELEVGGTNAAMWSGDGTLWAVSRELRRSAIFGRSDGLHLFEDWARTPLAAYDAADQRHRFEYASVAAEPFGLPVVAVLDERAPFQGQTAGGFTCWYRPLDGDGDGVPDEAEARLGTDPDEADSDGDGRTDGEELLLDESNPLGDGASPGFDLGVGSPVDGGVGADGGATDAALVDMEVDAAAAEDGALPDAAEADAAVIDAGAVEPDAAPVDGALVDGAVNEADTEPPVRAEDAGADAAVMAGGDATPVGVSPDPGEGCSTAPGGSGGASWLAVLLLGLWRRRR